MNDTNNCIRIYRDDEQIRRCTKKLDELELGLIRLARVLNMVGNENRLKLIYLLREESGLCVCDLSDILGMTIPAVSQHLRKLKDAQLIQARKTGQTVFYSLRTESIDLLRVLLTPIETLQKSPQLVA